MGTRSRRSRRDRSTRIGRPRIVRLTVRRRIAPFRSVQRRNGPPRSVLLRSEPRKSVLLRSGRRKSGPLKNVPRRSVQLLKSVQLLRSVRRRNDRLWSGRRWSGSSRSGIRSAAMPSSRRSASRRRDNLSKPSRTRSAPGATAPAVRHRVGQDPVLRPAPARVGHRSHAPAALVRQATVSPRIPPTVLPPTTAGRRPALNHVRPTVCRRRQVPQCRQARTGCARRTGSAAAAPTALLRATPLRAVPCRTALQLPAVQAIPALQATPAPPAARLDQPTDPDLAARARLDGPVLRRALLRHRQLVRPAPPTATRRTRQPSTRATPR